MPRTRTDLDREQKREEILGAAVSQLRASGYTSLSVDSVAQSLGLARNAVYWYFPSRDELYVSASARVLTEAWSRPPRTTSLEKRIGWALDQLADLQPLIMGLQERARTLPSAAAVVEQLQLGLCLRLREVLRGHVADSDVDDVADTIVMLGQGMLASGAGDRDRARLLRFVLRRVADVT